MEIENLLYLCNRSANHDEVLREYADYGRKQWRKLKLAYFKNSRWRKAAILEIKNSQYFHNHTTDRDEILREHADSGYKPCEKLKFAHFQNSTWRTAAILKIELYIAID